MEGLSGPLEASDCYAYVGNNPLLSTDPLGLWSVDDTLDWAANGLLHGPGAKATSFIVGFGDAASFGLTELARDAAGTNCVVAKDGYYFAGGLTGAAVSTVALGGFGNAGSLATSSAGLATAGVTARAAGLTATAVDSAAVNVGIYTFISTSGRLYVGQSGNITARLAQHVASGKVTEEAAAAAERIAVSGGKVAREIQEQLRIDGVRGGVEVLENIVNPIGPKRFGLMPNQPYIR